MADIQHHDARKLLRRIALAYKDNGHLTYKRAAKLLGRVPPGNHARAVAQMCDLLDAAAALAGIPLLALVVVLTDSEEINPKAWKEYGKQREAILERSKKHQFSDADFKAISDALEGLEGRGNKQAWECVRKRFPGNALYKRLTEPYSAPTRRAINDLGTDAPDRVETIQWTYARDQKIRNSVLRRAKGKCEFCGAPGFVKHDRIPYLECHHIIALAKEGADRMTNVIALCPNDHREAHFGARSAEIEAEMIERVKSVEYSRVKG